MKTLILAAVVIGLLAVDADASWRNRRRRVRQSRTVTTQRTVDRTARVAPEIPPCECKIRCNGRVCRIVLRDPQAIAEIRAKYMASNGLTGHHLRGLLGGQPEGSGCASGKCDPDSVPTCIVGRRVIGDSAVYSKKYRMTYRVRIWQ